MTGLNYFNKCVTTDCYNFKARASRPEFWYFNLFGLIFALLIGVGSTIMELISGKMPTAWDSIIFVLLFVPTFAVGARRLHDTGLSGWYQLLYFIPFVGILLIVILNVRKGQPVSNKWGPPVPEVNRSSKVEDHLV